MVHIFKGVKWDYVNYVKYLPTQIFVNGPNLVPSTAVFPRTSLLTFAIIVILRRIFCLKITDISSMHTSHNKLTKANLKPALN